MRITNAIPSIFGLSQMMWLSGILVYSGVSTLIRLLLGAGGLLPWMTALTMKPVPTDHPALLFNLALILQKNIVSVVFVVVGYTCLLLVVSAVESMIYSYSADCTSSTGADNNGSFSRKWMKMILFLIMFTPILVLAGLLGYLAGIISNSLNLSSLPHEIIRFIFIATPLMILIPSRFYYLKGHGFLDSILQSLFNFRVYFKSTVLILLPSGCIYVVLVQLMQSTTTNLQLLLSFSPLLFALGAMYWFSWGISVFFTGKIFTKLTSNKEAYHDQFLETNPL